MVLRMRKWFRNIAVDSGVIIIADQEFYSPYRNRKLGKTFNKLGKRWRGLTEGVYYIEWTIPESWKGKVSGSGTLMVISGNVLISDPAYVVPTSRWGDFLEETNEIRDLPEGVILLDKMGGDGKYNLTLDIERIFDMSHERRS